jgi:hypothetical protein
VGVNVFSCFMVATCRVYVRVFTKV